jgi:hypothetical protein
MSLIALGIDVPARRGTVNRKQEWRENSARHPEKIARAHRTPPLLGSRLGGGDCRSDHTGTAGGTESTHIPRNLVERNGKVPEPRTTAPPMDRQAVGGRLERGLGRHESVSRLAYDLHRRVRVQRPTSCHQVKRLAQRIRWRTKTDRMEFCYLIVTVSQ